MELAIIFGAMLLVSVLMLSWPFFRRDTEDSATATDLALFRDQLSQTDDPAMRLEIERRMLRAHRLEEEDQSVTLSASARRTGMAIMFVSVPVAVIGLYAWLGAPEQRSMPRGLQSMEEILDSVTPDQIPAILAVQMRTNADDPTGWELLVQSGTRTRQFQYVVQGYENLARLMPQEAAYHAGLGEARIAVEGGIVTAEAKAAFERAVALNPELPRPHYYLGLYEKQQGNNDAARARWEALLASSPSDAPWVPAVRASLGELPVQD